MTSAGSMLEVARALWRVVAVACVLWVAWGCAGEREALTTPRVLESPYAAASGDRLWAVAPLRNESGTSAADVLRIGDALASAITEVRGLRALPTNRVLDAMRALEIGVIDHPSQAAALAEALGVDGLLLGSVTWYDPYDPPALGISLALYVREGAVGGDLDPRVLTRQATEYDYFPLSSRGSGPASSVALHLDGRNHEVLSEVRGYATGRHDAGGAYGWKRYLASMDLYERFAAHHAIDRLLRMEADRVGSGARGS